MTWATDRPSPRNAALPPDWAARRRAVLDRDGHRCRIGTPGACTGIATTVDHVVAVVAGGSHELGNLQSACSTCHQGKSNAEASAARWRVREKRTPERHPGLRP